jgi:hypothetical protein
LFEKSNYKDEKSIENNLPCNIFESSLKEVFLMEDKVCGHVSFQV